jgi:hypothetical protein
VDMRRSDGGRRWAGLAAGLLAAAGGFVGLQLGGAGPAAAATGIQVINSPVSAFDSQPNKLAVAACPVGKRVISGGGWVMVSARGDEADKVVLTQLQPVHPTSGGQDIYVATGQEIGAAGTTANWQVQAFAVCADPIAGLHIQPSFGTAAPDEFKNNIARCGTNERVLGVGGRVNAGAGRVPLSTVSAFDTSATATARAIPGGGAGDWSVDAWAVCAPVPSGYQIVSALSAQGPSDSVQVGFVNCPTGKKMYGLASTVNSVIEAGVGLQVLFPGSPVESSSVEAVPTSTNWGPVRTQAICAF